ncbi:hypothetical protein CRYUN_Cryun18bG0042000 [Craigia yunnanensis]
MASSLALKRLVSSNILPSSMRSIRPMAVAPSTSRLFNTNTMREFDDDGDERDLNYDRRHVRLVSRRGDGFFSDVFDPFSPTRSLSQVLDQFMENPFLSASRGMGHGLRQSWDVKETRDALDLQIDMPTLLSSQVMSTMFSKQKSCLTQMIAAWLPGLLMDMFYMVKFWNVVSKLGCWLKIRDELINWQWNQEAFIYFTHAVKMEYCNILILELQQLKLFTCHPIDDSTYMSVIHSLV